MTQSAHAARVRLSAAALAVAGILFVLYPAIRPFSDEASLHGAAAFASTEWLVAHVLAIVAFTLLPLGLLGLHGTVRQAVAERHAYGAVVLSLIGTGLTVPFYGAEAYGLYAIGQAAVRQQNAALLTQVAVVRSGAGLVIFLVGLLLLAMAAVMAAIAVWNSGRYPKGSGIPMAVGVGLYVPQFFWTQPFRVAHGVLVAVGCLWIAVGVWSQGKAP
ncbi:MAG: hypothetical protein QN157_10115 [Armatimonadota bacterium]|nr:hypothetical protein [Armatimonadota bacterium]